MGCLFCDSLVIRHLLCLYIDISIYRPVFAPLCKEEQDEFVQIHTARMSLTKQPETDFIRVVSGPHVLHSGPGAHCPAPLSPTVLFT